MRRLNPLLAESVRGLAEPGKPHATWLGYLAIQAGVLFLWWPKSDLARVLATANPPDPLLAVAIAYGAALAYYSLRAGAEEFLLPGQNPLGEWVLATRIGLGRILRGYVGSQVLLSVHASLFAAPLLLAAMTVGGGNAYALTAIVLAALAQALFYRLLGALIVLTLGARRGLVTFLLRAALPFGYAVSTLLLPIASHVSISYRLFGADAGARTAESMPDPLIFAGIYAALSAVAAGALYRLLARHRHDARAGEGAGRG